MEGPNSSRQVFLNRKFLVDTSFNIQRFPMSSRVKRVLTLYYDKDLVFCNFFNNFLSVL